MNMPLPRDDYRYTVEVDGETITPLAAACCYVGEETLRILNISRGGLALLFNKEPKISEGDRLGVSVEIRGRSFPVEIEIRRIRGLRANCQFVGSARAFQGALKEFLQPKFLGETFKRQEELADREDILKLVPNAEKYEAYIGQNQTGAFVWLKTERVLARIVGVSQDMVFEWTEESGLKTGRRASKTSGESAPLGDDAEIQWSRLPDSALVHYFADIMLSWLNSANGREFVESLFNDDENPELQQQKLRFPRP